MFLKGLGIKARVKTIMAGTIKKLLPAGIFYNAPAKAIHSQDWLLKHNKVGAKMYPVFEAQDRSEAPPVIVNHELSQRWKKYYSRQVPAAYVLELPQSMVYGVESNYIITPTNHLLADVSREFGRYGGKPMHESKLIRQTLKLPPPVYLKGNVAVITTAGSNNFHHWNYDAIPRIHLLKKAGLFQKIDRFIIAHSDLPFQQQTLQLLQVPAGKIINPKKTGNTLFRAEILYVPSLPSKLGTVSPWVMDMLRSLYNPGLEKDPRYKRVYLSRKNVTSRKIINNEAFGSLLKEFDIVEIFPEDYTVTQLAKILDATKFIISIHGSGLSNLCFISAGTTVIDILAPYHQDGYYWMMTNIRHSKYIGFFAEGEHPADDFDLVKNKVDHDLLLDIDKLRQLLKQEIKHA